MDEDRPKLNQGAYFGSEIGMYGAMLKIGSFLTIVGIAIVIIGFSIVPKSVIGITGIVILFIGLMLAFSGYTGYRDEMKKYGRKRVYTGYGKGSITSGIFSVLIMAYPFIAIGLGIVAIILGKMALSKGDNTYASAGLLAGIIGLVGGVIVWGLFYFSGAG